MLYKHWKKIALTLTALFWASCDNTSNEAPLYGVPACDTDKCDIEEPESSSEAAKPESSESANTESSSSETSEAASSSSEITCVPLDSTVTYFYDDYIADVKKMWSEQAAKRDAAAKIDSIKTTLVETPMCLENLRMELESLVALYGAPVVIDSAVESCSDGTIRPREEYAKFLKMKEEWEANLPALDAECKKVYEDKMKELEDRINKCLNDN